MELGLKIHSGYGYKTISLARHSIRSIPIGTYPSGRTQFDTERTPIGKALYKLKNDSDLSQVDYLVNQAHKAVIEYFSFDEDREVVVIPMPSSKQRRVQPVPTLAKALTSKLGVKWTKDFLAKKSTGEMKNIDNHSEKYAALENSFYLKGELKKRYDVILLDDLFDTGATLKRAMEALEKSNQIGKIYGLTITRTKKS